MPSIPFITKIRNESADLLTAELVDLTEDYGVGGNAERSELALYLYLWKRDVELNDTEVTIDNTSPTTVTAWLFNLAGDGWYVAIVFGFYIYSGAETYDEDDCVYYPTTGLYYKCLQDGTTGITPVAGLGTEWEAIADILADVIDLDSNVFITQTDNFTKAAGQKKSGDILQPLGQKLINGKCRNWEDAASSLVVRGLLQSAQYNHQRSQNQNGQEIMDYINDRFAA